MAERARNPRVQRRSPLLLRHAEPEVASGVCYGQLDVPLSPRGRAQARALRSAWFTTPDVIFCSDLLRARETVELVFPTASAVRDDSRLRELHMGDWEGQSWDAIHENDPDALASWGSDWMSTSPPGGESGQQLFSRVSEFIDENYRDLASAVIVAHQGSLRAIGCYCQNRPLSELFSLSFSYLAPACLFRGNH
ncbi:MAG: alpha-ribazole phosphatase family protein [Pseudomonadota bacterium]